MNIFRKIKNWLNEEVDEFEFENGNETFDDYMFGERTMFTSSKSLRTRKEIFTSDFNSFMLKFNRNKREYAIWWTNHRDLLTYSLFGLSIYTVYFFVK